MAAAPKAPRLTAIVTRMPRLKNCRRLMPSSSSSTGARSATAVLPRVAGAAPPDPIALRVSSARSRAASDASSSAESAASVPLWSRWRVSALNDPVTRPCASAARRRPAATIITAASTSRTGMAMMRAVLTGICS